MNQRLRRGSEKQDAQSDVKHSDSVELAIRGIVQSLSESRLSGDALAREIGDIIMRTVAIETELSIARERIEGFDRGFNANSEAVESMRARIGGLDDGAATLAAASVQAASATEEISASIEHMSAVSASRYGEVKDLADMARKGQAEMAATLSVIRDITDSVDSLKEFINAINDIAERTSLLAMNASIEAAHAGSSGKGFAVIAGEVRKLASSSGDNANAISSRLNALIASIRKAEEASDHTAEIFNVVEGRVQRATDSFLEIRHGTEELAVGGREIRESVGSLRSISTGMKESSAELRKVATAFEVQTDRLRSESAELVGKLVETREMAEGVNLGVLEGSQGTVALVKTMEKAYIAAAGNKAEGRKLYPLLSLQHLTWVSRTRAVLDGRIKLEASAVGDHHSCDLGHWMDSDGRAKLGQAAWEELNARHESLHRKAQELVQVSNEGRGDEAESIFKNLIGISESVVALLAKAFPDHPTVPTKAP